MISRWREISGRWYVTVIGDLGIIAVALAVTGFATLGAARARNGSAARIEITAPGGWSRSLALSAGGVTEVPGLLGVTKVEVAGGRARIAASPCPRGVCVSRGPIGPSAGDPLVCVPNGVVVRLAGGGTGELDARTR